uniref:Uncharacterized protein n=2 Tax=unclassified Caudoviricetes TaxID=2788787 RepID=A0A8S5PHD1_9CAUD|nr:MAG TPA: hypothetical protein [Siphoviridae sp. ctJcm18]DAE06599.1 MAG TPA: hypothetical protein [Siphoviridae sp. ctUGQ45]
MQSSPRVNEITPLFIFNKILLLLSSYINC